MLPHDCDNYSGDWPSYSLALSHVVTHGCMCFIGYRSKLGLEQATVALSTWLKTHKSTKGYDCGRKQACYSFSNIIIVPLPLMPDFLLKCRLWNMIFKKYDNIKSGLWMSFFNL